MHTMARSRLFPLFIAAGAVLSALPLAAQPAGYTRILGMLQSGDTLKENQYLVAYSNAAFAVMQDDGNFCFYRGSSPADNKGKIWCSETGGRPKGQYMAYVGVGVLAVIAGRQVSPANILWTSPKPTYEQRSTEKARLYVDYGGDLNLRWGNNIIWSTTQKPFNVNATTKGPYGVDDVISPAVSTGGGFVHLLMSDGAPGSNRMLYRRAPLDGANLAWSQPEPITMGVSGGAVVWASDGVHAFMNTQWGVIDHCVRGASGTWSSCERLKGGPFQGRPAAVNYKGTIYVFARSFDDSLRYHVGTDPASGWLTVPAKATSSASPMAMVDTVANRFIVTGIIPTSGGGSLTRFKDGNWEGWSGLYIQPQDMAYGPLLIAPHYDQPGAIAVGHRGPAPTRVIVGTPFATGGDEAARIIDGPSIAGYPALLRNGAGELAVIALGTDGILRYARWPRGQVDWTDWVVLKLP